jgi:hypothetical protein
MAKRKQTEYIQGHATHRRTEGDYMGVLLDAVSLDDWRGGVTGALQAAKGGDPQARNWLRLPPFSLGTNFPRRHWVCGRF